MDGLSFVSESIKALAWPVAAVCMVMLLRQPIGKLIPLLRKLKYKDLEAEFSEGLDRAEKDAEKAIPSTLKQVAAEPKEDSITADLRGLLEISPEAAVLEGWRRFENVVLDTGKRLNVAYPVHGSVMAIIDRLRFDGHLTPRQVRLVKELRRLRNVAAHAGRDDAISVADAARFLAIIEPLATHLKSLQPPPDRQAN